MSVTRDVLFENLSGQDGDLGVITLNRPSALNSLNHEMITAMQQHLNDWAVDPAIKAVVIRAAEGRAFCAGGDIRLVYEHAKQNNPAMTEFFYEEYHLNRTIFHFPKPYIALLDGITMGGGVGVSIHGSHRVATEHLTFAMPETGIGFFPDVGGTYFLPRLHDAMGFYLGLTGARMKIDDCMALGIATHHVKHHVLPDLLDALCRKSFGSDARASVSEIMAAHTTSTAKASYLSAQPELQHCFSASTIENIFERLQSAAHPLCHEAYATMQKKSPTSLKVTLQALHDGKNLDFDACMRQEFRLVSRFLLGHDFIEGIRALIIDKDQAPNWQPPVLDEVNTQMVNEYFAPLTKELA